MTLFSPFRRHFDTLLRSVLTSTMLDYVTWFSRVNNVRNTYKLQRYSQTSWRDFLSDGGKLAESEG